VLVLDPPQPLMVCVVLETAFAMHEVVFVLDHFNVKLAPKTMLVELAVRVTVGAATAAFTVKLCGTGVAAA
jgi:hypothetical protein